MQDATAIPYPGYEMPVIPPQEETALDFLISLKDAHLVPWSRERAGYPTNSELRRWLNDRAVVINGRKLGPFDPVERPVNSLVFFPKSKGRVTVR